MRRFRRLALVGGALALAGLAAAWVSDRAGYEPGPWLQDLEALEQHMGLAYANLKWVVEHRGLELFALDRRARQAIERAGSRRGARKAIGAFVEAFDDPHLRIERRPPGWLAWLPGVGNGNGGGEPGEGPAFPADASGRDVCRHFGYENDGHGFAFDVQALPGWSPLPDDGAFPAGVFSTRDGRRAGILRIAQFGEDKYLSACAAAWDAEAADRRGPCGGDCLEAFRLRASDALARQVASRVVELRATGIEALVVDVTGNGGGSEWVDPVTRIFSDRPLRSMRVTVVRHPRGLASAAERLAAVDALLADTLLTEESRALLEVARGRLADILAELAAPCERSSLWQGRAPGCSQTVTAPAYATGVFDYLPGDALSDVPIRDELYSPFGRDVPAGVWSGPLYVLVDAASASATEAFVAMLLDNGAATVIGERTYGAGCGYTDGGLPIELPNSGLVVWMPDCARYRIDGTNEIEGIDPDVGLEWSELNGAERAAAVAQLPSASSSDR
jgi:hypothetical protein